MNFDTPCVDSRSMCRQRVKMRVVMFCQHFSADLWSFEWMKKNYVDFTPKLRGRNSLVFECINFGINCWYIGTPKESWLGVMTLTWLLTRGKSGVRWNAAIHTGNTGTGTRGEGHQLMIHFISLTGMWSQAKNCGLWPYIHRNSAVCLCVEEVWGTKIFLVPCASSTTRGTPSTSTS